MKSQMKKLSILLLSFIYFTVSSQQPKAMSSSEILLGMKKLNVVGNALYLAAHPDDENTNFIAYLSKERLVRTGYMALTRGDGGQNLVGSEQSEYVGLLRTHELLGARSIDGGEQYFSRANDYGFTKTTEEAIDTWGRNEILSDIVWRIRKFQPDVIINRFPPDNRAGHGHHSASAVLSKEAFAMAGDSTKFPEQLKFVKPWQAKRLVWNSYTPGFQNNSPEGSFVKVQIGDFNPLLGKSYTEISAEARSMHKSQGFGSAKTRNQRVDYALHVLGEAAKDDIFDGIDLTWKRVKKGEFIENAIKQMIENYSAINPSKSTKKLLEIYDLISKLEPSVYTIQKQSEIKQLLAACAGLWFETNAVDFSAAPTDKIKMTTTVVNRSDVAIKLISLKLNGLAKDSAVNTSLLNNQQFTAIFEVNIDKNQPISQPYWLAETWRKGLYTVNDLELRGLPMKPATLTSTFLFEIEGTPVNFTVPIQYKYVEPSDGEIYKYFEIRPEVMANIEEEVYAFNEQKPKNIFVTLKAGKANISGKIKLIAESGWSISPAEIDFKLKDKNQEQKLVFTVNPPVNVSETTLKVSMTTINGEFNRGLKTITYKHVPELNLFPVSEAKLIRMDLKKKGNNIGYVSGAGDKVPAALAQIGYNVTMLDYNAMSQDLSKFDAIVIGVRAYNTEEWLRFAQEKLMNYVKEGGNMVVQYQTSNFLGGMKIDNIGPFPFGIGRNRVTIEEADVKFLLPEHPTLNKPNKITKTDFNGWIQERGLYFADKWDGNYETIFSMNDPNETIQEGNTLYTKFGKGNYIFTGLAFFRQLPAGVPGAYRLFTNFLSVGK